MGDIYGYKETDVAKVEVFNNNYINQGDILGKISIYDKKYEKFKSPLISNIDLSKEELDKIIMGN